MATPNIDEILKQFLGRIGQKPEFFSDGGIKDGVLLSGAEAVAYVNRAFFVLMEEMFAKIDAKTISTIQPSMTKIVSVTVTGGVYVPGAGNKDFYKLLWAKSEVFGKAFRKIPLAELDNCLNGPNPYYRASENNPIVTESNGKLLFYPVTIFETPSGTNPIPGIDTLEIAYVIKPVNPNTGGLLQQNGSYDVLFESSWFTKIAEIADQLYKKDMQESM